MALFVLEFWLSFLYRFTIINSINRLEYITLSRFLYELWPFFQLRILVKLFCTNLLFFKTITDIALKLTTLFDYHYLQQQTTVHNSVKVFVRIMAIFRLRILVKFFVPPHFFQNHLSSLPPSLPQSTDKGT